MFVIYLYVPVVKAYVVFVVSPSRATVVRVDSAKCLKI